MLPALNVTRWPRNDGQGWSARGVESHFLTIPRHPEAIVAMGMEHGIVIPKPRVGVMGMEHGLRDL